MPAGGAAIYPRSIRTRQLPAAQHDGPLGMSTSIKQASVLVQLLTGAALEAGRSPDPETQLQPLANAAVERVRAAWPELDVDLAAFFQHLVSVMDEPSAAELERLAVEDLYLDSTRFIFEIELGIARAGIVTAGIHGGNSFDG